MSKTKVMKTAWAEAFDLAKVMIENAQLTGKMHLLPDKLKTSSVHLADDISSEWDPIEVRQAIMWNAADWAAYWQEVAAHDKQTTVATQPTGQAALLMAEQHHTQQKGYELWPATTKAAVVHRAEPTTFTMAGITITAGPFRDIKYNAAYDVLVDLTGGAKPEVPVQVNGPLAAALGGVIPQPASFLAISWPDMGVLALSRSFWAAVLAHVRTTPYRHLGIGCLAGLGRTGTALACLLRASDPSITGPEAIATVRRLYNKGAVETKDQEAYVASL